MKIFYDAATFKQRKTKNFFIYFLQTPYTPHIGKEKYVNHGKWSTIYSWWL